MSTRGRRSGRWTRTRLTSPTSTRSRPATQELNFIVEHVGLPRIEDFCFMATQERNVYAGLAVVVGGLTARPPALLHEGDGRAAVLGRRGQDAVRRPTTPSGSQSGRSRGSSTGMLTPTRRSPTSRGSRPSGRRRSSASTRRSSTTSRSRRSSSSTNGPALRRPRRTRRLVEKAPRDGPRARPRRARHGLRPRARRTDHLAEVRQLVPGVARRGRRRPAAVADAPVRAELRLPHGRRRAQRRAPAAGGRRGHRRPRGPLHGRRDQRGDQPRRGVRGRLPRRDRR